MEVFSFVSQSQGKSFSNVYDFLYTTLPDLDFIGVLYYEKFSHLVNFFLFLKRFPILSSSVNIFIIRYRMILPASSAVSTAILL